jgi:O-antigen/teichoic acid export membrane protein
MTNTAAARGTIALVLSQGIYFVLGYLAVVLLARELGPSSYGVYGIIMSVLVWLEQSGRSAIPSAATKLLADTPHGREALAKTALALNFGLHLVLFVLLWVTAPWLASWLGIANGTFLFRLAAVDLPLFGVYTALQGVHQGYRRFVRLGLSQVMYALTKLVGVLLIIGLGVSLHKALLVNISASLAGVVFLLSGINVRSAGWWFVGVSPIVAIAAPMGLYSISLLLISSLDLWTLQTMSAASEAAITGIFVAALNIARVPGFALSAVSAVLLPSVSKAVVLGDVPLVKRYINQALRFFCILYLPICLVLMAQPEALMQWVYSNTFTGGGIFLSILLVSQGLWAVHAVLGSVLIAADQARKIAAVMGLSTLPALPIFIIFVFLWGGVGAAVASAVIPFFGVLIFATLLKRQFGTFLDRRSMSNIGLAGALMFLVYGLLPHSEGMLILSPLISLVLYIVTLILSDEITPQDFAVFLSWQKAK